MEHYYPTPEASIFGSSGMWASLAIDPDGTTLHSTAYVDGSGMVYCRSDDEGKTWNTPVVIDANGTNNVLEHPLVVTDAGVIVAVYETAGELKASRSTNGGANWSAPVTLHTKVSGQIFRCGMGTNGEIVHIAYARINDGVTPPIRVGQMWYRKSTDAGANWSAAIEPYPNGGTYESASRPDICVNGNVVHITYAALRTGDTILQDEEIVTGRSTDGGNTWEALVIHKNNSSTFAHRPDIVTNSDGVLLLAWQESLDGGGSADLDIRIRRSIDNGASWGSITRFINVPGAPSEHAAMSLSGNRAVLSWAEWASSSPRANAKYSEDAGVTWTAIENVNDVFLGGAPVAELSENFVHIMVLDENNYMFHLRSWFDVTEPVETNLLEDFEGAAAGPPPNANWTNNVITNVAGEGIVKDGSGRGTRKIDGGYRQGSRWNAGTFGPDVDIVIELAAVPDTDGDSFHFGIGYTFGASNLDSYGPSIERLNATSYLFQVWRNNNSSTTTIVQSTDLPAIGVGSKLGFQKRGEMVRVLHKPSGGSWSILAETTDSTYLAMSGYPFLELVDNQAVRVANMWATTIVEIPPLQQLRPDADVVTTGWSTAPLYSKVNDSSDATIITATAS